MDNRYIYYKNISRNFNKNYGGASVAAGGGGASTPTVSVGATTTIPNTHYLIHGTNYINVPPIADQTTTRPTILATKKPALPDNEHYMKMYTETGGMRSGVHCTLDNIFPDISFLRGIAIRSNLNIYIIMPLEPLKSQIATFISSDVCLLGDVIIPDGSHVVFSRSYVKTANEGKASDSEKYISFRRLVEYLKKFPGIKRVQSSNPSQETDSVKAFALFKSLYPEKRDLTLLTEEEITREQAMIPADIPGIHPIFIGRPADFMIDNAINQLGDLYILPPSDQPLELNGFLHLTRDMVKYGVRILEILWRQKIDADVPTARTGFVSFQRYCSIMIPSLDHHEIHPDKFIRIPNTSLEILFDMVSMQNRMFLGKYKVTRDGEMFIEPHVRLFELLCKTTSDKGTLNMSYRDFINIIPRIEAYTRLFDKLRFIPHSHLMTTGFPFFLNEDQDSLIKQVLYWNIRYQYLLSLNKLPNRPQITSEQLDTEESCQENIAKLVVKLKTSGAEVLLSFSSIYLIFNFITILISRLMAGRFTAYELGL